MEWVQFSFLRPPSWTQEILPQAELCVADSWEEIERFPEQIRGFLLNLL